MIYKSILLLICCVFILGCTNSVPVEGTLIYTAANTIRALELKTKKSRTLYQSGTDNVYNSINIIKDNIFLVENYNIIKGYLVEVINISTGEITLEVEGSRPLYIDENNMLLFIKNSMLFSKKLGEQVSVKIADDIHQYSKAPIRISKTEIAYFNKQNKVTIYDLHVNKSRYLGNIVNLMPWGYIASSNSLICKSQENGSFYAINLKDPDNPNKFNISHSEFAVNESIIVTSDNDNLIYSKVGVSLSERQDMYLYLINERKELKYIKDVTITSGVHIR